jgi:hypothetical protein
VWAIDPETVPALARFLSMKMQRYADHSGRSGIIAFEVGEDYLDVRFTSGDVYHYTSRRPGERDLAHMKELALRGEGLSTFISRHIGVRYDSKRTAGPRDFVQRHH